jgi:hypothetical protein
LVSGVRLAAALVAIGVPARAAAPPAVLRDADVEITVTSPTSCEVSMALTVDGAREIDHRVQALDGAVIELVSTRGAGAVSDVRTIGRTESLVLRPDGATYEIRYRVRLPDDAAARCPIWLPAVPADGRSRAVGIRVQLPPGASPGHSMPRLDWTGPRGSARLAHLPAFVHVPYASDGQSPAWTIGEAMDGVAVLVFAAGSAGWAWRRRR